MDNLRGLENRHSFLQVNPHSFLRGQGGRQSLQPGQRINFHFAHFCIHLESPRESAYRSVSFSIIPSFLCQRLLFHERSNGPTSAYSCLVFNTRSSLRDLEKKQYRSIKDPVIDGKIG